jgi:hypothetical protein
VEEKRFVVEMNARRDRIFCTCWDIVKTAKSIVVVDLIFSILYLISSSSTKSQLQEVTDNIHFRNRDLMQLVFYAHRFLSVLSNLSLLNLLFGSLYLIGIIKVKMF